MLKVDYGHGTDATAGGLYYIAGLKSKKKKEKENIFSSIDLISRRDTNALLADWSAHLAPRKEGQRKLRRTDVRFVMSWKGYAKERDIRLFVDDFLEKSGFNKHLNAWACHSITSKRTGEKLFHIHLFVCPRNKETGEVIDVRKGQLKILKELYAELSEKYALSVGYDLSAVQKTRKPNKKHGQKQPSKDTGKGKKKSLWIARNKKAKTKTKAKEIAPQRKKG